MKSNTDEEEERKEETRSRVFSSLFPANQIAKNRKVSEEPINLRYS
jgi:hypothetical protein